MPQVEKRTVSLPAEHAAFLDQMVESGAYASVSEVVRAGLRALQERDVAVERWLQQDVAATYDAMVTEPDRVVALSEVMAELRERHRAKLAVA